MSALTTYTCGILYWGVEAAIVIPSFSWDITIVSVSAARNIQRFLNFTLVVLYAAKQSIQVVSQILYEQD